MMGALATSAAKRYNLKYGHIGHLFQGPFRYEPIPMDALWDVACYIHLNPVRANLVRSPEEWKFSNFVEFLSNSSSSNIQTMRNETVVSAEWQWEGYPNHVRAVLENERAEGEFWKRIKSLDEGYLPNG